MRRANRKNAARDAAQIALLAPWVAGSRMMSAMADWQRGRFDAVETTRMWTEKSAAFAESWIRANTALARFAFRGPFSAKSNVLEDIASAVTAPARRRVAGNARRLAKKRRR